MAFSRSDRAELLLPLFAGAFETPPWHRFLRGLAMRTGADRVLLVTGGAGVDSPLRYHRALAPQGDPGRFPSGEERAAIGALPLSALRVARVYALDELHDLDSAERRERQNVLLITARIGDARLMRVLGPRGSAAWLAVLAERATFDAADSVLLADLAPAIEAALANHRTASELRLRAEMAEATLARMGIGQAVVDSAGHILVADATWQAGPAPSAAELEAAFGTAGYGEGWLVRATARPDGVALARPCPGTASRLYGEPAALATIRVSPTAVPRSAVAIAAAQFGLAPREAALALALAEGHPLIDAGAMLGLSAETTRTYSKRVYAKTGTRGQADLVRAILSSLAVFG